MQGHQTKRNFTFNLACVDAVITPIVVYFRPDMSITIKNRQRISIHENEINDYVTMYAKHSQWLRPREKGRA